MSSSSDGSTRGGILSLCGGCFGRKRRTVTCHQSYYENPQNTYRCRMKYFLAIKASDVENERTKREKRSFGKVFRSRMRKPFLHLFSKTTPKQSFIQSLKNEDLLVVFSPPKTTDHPIISIGWRFSVPELTFTRQMFYTSYSRDTHWDRIMFRNLTEEAVAESGFYDDYNEPIVDGAPASIWLGMIDPLIPVWIKTLGRMPRHRRSNLTKRSRFDYLFDDELLIRHGDLNIQLLIDMFGPQQVIINNLHLPTFPTMELGIYNAPAATSSHQHEPEIHIRKQRRRYRWTGKSKSSTQVRLHTELNFQAMPISNNASNLSVSTTHFVPEIELIPDLQGSSDISEEARDPQRAAPFDHDLSGSNTICSTSESMERTFPKQNVDNGSEEFLEMKLYSFKTGSGFSNHKSDIDNVFWQEDMVDVSNDLVFGSNDKNGLDDFVDELVAFTLEKATQPPSTVERSCGVHLPVPWEHIDTDIVDQEREPIPDSSSCDGMSMANFISLDKENGSVILENDLDSDALTPCQEKDIMYDLNKSVYDKKLENIHHSLSFNDECAKDDLCSLNSYQSASSDKHTFLEEVPPYADGVIDELVKLNINHSARFHKNHDLLEVRCSQAPDTWVFDKETRTFNARNLRPEIYQVKRWGHTWSAYFNEISAGKCSNAKAVEALKPFQGRSGPVARRYFVKKMTSFLTNIDGGSSSTEEDKREPVSRNEQKSIKTDHSEKENTAFRKQSKFRESVKKKIGDRHGYSARNNSYQISSQKGRRTSSLPHKSACRHREKMERAELSDELGKYCSYKGSSSGNRFSSVPENIRGRKQRSRKEEEETTEEECIGPPTEIREKHSTSHADPITSNMLLPPNNGSEKYSDQRSDYSSTKPDRNESQENTGNLDNRMHNKSEHSVCVCEETSYLSGHQDRGRSFLQSSQYPTVVNSATVSGNPAVEWLEQRNFHCLSIPCLTNETGIKGCIDTSECFNTNSKFDCNCNLSRRKKIHQNSCSSEEESNISTHNSGPVYRRISPPNPTRENSVSKYSSPARRSAKILSTEDHTPHQIRSWISESSESECESSENSSNSSDIVDADGGDLFSQNSTLSERIDSNLHFNMSYRNKHLARSKVCTKKHSAKNEYEMSLYKYENGLKFEDDNQSVERSDIDIDTKDDLSNTEMVTSDVSCPGSSRRFFSDEGYVIINMSDTCHSESVTSVSSSEYLQATRACSTDTAVPVAQCNQIPARCYRNTEHAWSEESVSSEENVDLHFALHLRSQKSFSGLEELIRTSTPLQINSGNLDDNEDLGNEQSNQKNFLPPSCAASTTRPVMSPIQTDLFEVNDGEDINDRLSKSDDVTEKSFVQDHSEGGSGQLASSEATSDVCLNGNDIQLGVD